VYFGQSPSGLSVVLLLKLRVFTARKKACLASSCVPPPSVSAAEATLAQIAAKAIKNAAFMLKEKVLRVGVVVLLRRALRCDNRALTRAQR